MSHEKSFKAIISGKRRGIYPALLRGLLWLLQFPYAWVVAWRNRRFDNGIGTTQVEVPVISVGNLTTGGTGKTPVVCYLAGQLRQANRRVTILSRGYRADERGINDEALELEIRLPDVPHLQAPDRTAMARIAIDELGAEVLLLDDGFQHRRLARDFDLVVIDATEPFGYGHLLPRGLLREPVSQLSRADAVIINRCNHVTPEQVAGIRERVQQTAPEVPIAEASTQATNLIDHRGDTCSLDELAGQPVLAFCGIGNPAGFQSTLNELRVRLAGPLREFPDHHQYSRDDLSALQSWAAEHPECQRILCTHKDLVKIDLGHLGGKPLQAVLITCEIVAGKDQLWQKLFDKVRFQETPHSAPDPHP